MAQTGMVADGHLTDWISPGVPGVCGARDAVDDAAEAPDRGAKGAGGKLPPHVMVYFAMALALFADDDYGEVAARLTETLRGWDCWDVAWEVPASGGITQAWQRLGDEPLAEPFSRVTVPVAEELTQGAFLGSWRLMAIDGFEWNSSGYGRERRCVRVRRDRRRRPGEGGVPDPSVFLTGRWMSRPGC
jgi:hypothetical protein